MIWCAYALGFAHQVDVFREVEAAREGALQRPFRAVHLKRLVDHRTEPVPWDMRSKVQNWLRIITPYLAEFLQSVQRLRSSNVFGACKGGTH